MCSSRLVLTKVPMGWRYRTNTWINTQAAAQGSPKGQDCDERNSDNPKNAKQQDLQKKFHT
jgi:hypothetical protein